MELAGTWLLDLLNWLNDHSGLGGWLAAAATVGAVVVALRASRRSASLFEEQDERRGKAAAVRLWYVLTLLLDEIDRRLQGLQGLPDHHTPRLDHHKLYREEELREALGDLPGLPIPLQSKIATLLLLVSEYHVRLQSGGQAAETMGMLREARISCATVVGELHGMAIAPKRK